MAKRKKYADSATMYSIIDRLKFDLNDVRYMMRPIEAAYNRDELSEKDKRKFLKLGTDLLKALDKFSVF